MYKQFNFSFRKSTSALLVILVSIFTSSNLLAQCGFQATCSNTNYLNFGMTSNGDGTTIEYDNFVGGYHNSLVRTANGEYKVWGGGLANNGTGNLLVPTTIDATNFPALTGIILKAGIGTLGSGAAAQQGIVLTTTGLFAWGSEGRVIDATITSSTAFQKITINTQTDGLPAGVDPLDVKMMFTTNQTLAITTCSGDVYVLTMIAANGGVGATASSTVWHRVTEATAGNPFLTNVVAVRGQQGTLFALKSDGTLWTWGAETFLGDGSDQASRNRATQVTVPSGNPIKMIGVTRNDATDRSSYFVLNSNGSLYAMGENSARQLGDWTTTDRFIWVQPRYTAASPGGTPMNNIHWISPQEHDYRYAAMNVLTSDSTNYNWGTDSFGMLGRSGADENPNLPSGITAADKILGVESGGHTSMLAKKCEDYFGYVGHKVDGSMADGSAANVNITSYTFATAIIYICGATNVDITFSGTPSLSPSGLYCNGSDLFLNATPTGGTYSVTGPGFISNDTLYFTGTGNTSVVVSYTATIPGCPSAGTTTRTFSTEDCIDAVNDPAMTGTSASTPTIVGSVIGNDTLNGSPVTIANTNVTPGTNGPLSINADGDVTVAANTPSGVYPITYQICSAGSPTICDNATATVTITNVIDAVNDGPTTVVSGSTPTSAGSVIGNDLLNGVAVTTANTDVTPVTTGPLSVDANGNLTVAPNTVSGTYNITYQLCETGASPANCDNAVATVIVDNVIDAVNDGPTTVISGASPTSAGSVIVNDSINGVLVTTTNTDVTPGTTGPLSIDANGLVTVAANTPSGTYTINYQLCETGASPANCDNAVATVIVDNVIDAVNDGPTTVASGSSPTSVGSVIVNDSINGVLVTTSNTDVTPGTNGPLSVDADGNITLAANTVSGTYTINYQLCETGASPANCDNAVATVIVDNVIDAVNDGPTTVASATSPVSAGSVIVNDSLNGVLVTIANTDVTPGTNGPLSIDTDGNVTVAANTPSGTYTINYQLCETGALPPNCDNAVATVIVALPIVAVNDPAVTVTSGASPTSAGSVILNDSLGGVVVTLANTDVTPGTTGPLSVDANGNLTVAPNTPSGTYTINYELCETGAVPPNCDNATATVIVDNVLDAVNDGPTTVITGASPTSAGSVIVNDSINGVLVTTANTDVTPGTNGPLSIDANGNLTVAANTPSGTYTINYQLCETGATPANCDNATATVIVDNVIDAVNDGPTTVISGASPTSAGSVIVNDSINGVLVTTTNTDVTPGTTGPLSIDANGLVTVAANTPSGTYTINYQLCETGASPVNCDNAVATVIVDNVIDAVNDGPTTVASGPSPIPAGNVIGNDSINGVLVTTSNTDVTPGTNGPLSVDANGNITVAPNTVSGTYTINYQLCETGASPANCDNAVATVIVDNVIDAVNDGTMSASSSTTPVVAGSVLVNDSLNGVLVTTLNTDVTPGANGPLSVDANGNITVAANTPTGSYTINYELCETGAIPANCDIATATVLVVNPIIAVVDPTVIMASGTTPLLVGNVLANDSLGGVVVSTANTDVTPSTNGPLSIDIDGDITLAANTISGIYTITYEICETGATPPNCDTATDTVVVANPVVAVDDVETTPEDIPVIVDILGNDIDVPSNGTLTITQPSNGVVTVNDNGTPNDPSDDIVTYTPNPNFNGVDTFIYVICDLDPLPAPNCDTAEVVITIDPVNDAPTTTDIAVETLVDTPIGVNVGAGTSDPENNPLTYTYGAPSVAGTTVTVTGPGNIDVTPPTGFVGTITIPFTVCDSSEFAVNVLCTTGTITVTVVDTVGGVNNPPLANNDLVTTDIDSPVTVNPLGNDYDVNGDDLTVTIAPGGNPTNGTASVDPVTGEITYTPNPGFYGQDTITYVICDGGTPDLCDTAEIIVTIAPVVDEPNVGPIATNDYGTTPEDTPITIGVMNNDSDPNGNPLNDPTIITPPSNGTASVNADGTITYTPNPNFVGQDTLYYEICDTGSPVICDTAMVVITITPANDAPTTTDIAVETLVDTPIGVNVGAGTSDPENNPLTYTYGAPSVAGTTVTVTGPGNIDVTPPTGFVGTITIPFTVCDSSEFAVNVLCTTGTITVTVVDTVGGVNNPPLANNDLVTTDIDSPVTVNPLGNDYDVNGDDLTVTIAPGGNPTNGTASVDPVTGEITYTPNPGFYGQDTITYVICDGGTPDLCDTAEIIVTIAPVVDEPNVGPIATNDYGTTPEDTPITIGVMNNDSDPNGNPLNDPTIITPPSNGTASVNADGTITYTPNPNFVGQDTLYYEICDTGSPVICDTAMVVITITPANDAPTTTDIAVETLVDTPIGVNVGAGTSDPENNPLTYTYGAPSVAGTTVTVTGPGNIDVAPPTGFVGTITIPFTVCDSSEFAVNVLCTTGTITVTVVDTVGGVNNPPLANNDLVTTDIDSPVTVNPLGNDYDVNGDDLTVTIAPGGNPTNGTASVDPVTGEITYTPNPGFYGQDTITYVICDGGTPDLCDTAEIIVTIAPVVDEPNVGPIATNDYGTTPEDTPITIGVMNNDSDPNGNPLNDPTIITPPSNGTASVNADGTITYTPNPNFVGQDTLYYEICDTGSPVICDTAMVVITITPANDAPTTTDIAVETLVDTPIGVNVGAGTSDPENNPLTYTYGAPSVAGTTVTVTGPGNIDVTPPTGFVGTITIPFTVCDSSEFAVNVLCTTGTITVTVVDTTGGANNPPLANNDLVTTDIDSPVTVNPLGNDYDVNGDDLTVTIAPGGNPTNGTASVDPVTGEITYTPNPGFYGQDTITYVICDGGTPDLCDTAEIIVTIAPVVDEPNVGPIATNDYGTTPEDTPITIGVMNNDSDPNGNPLNDPTIITPPSNGTASVNADGTITYTPNPNFVGQDTLYYEICDTGSPVICDTAMVVITITPANDAPTTTDIAVETLVDTPIGVNVGAGTSDPENNPLTYTYGAPSVAGTTVTVTGPGNIDVTPPTGFVGTITIPFTVCDSSEFAVNVLCTTGTITVTVVDTTGGANNPPLANNDLVTTDIDSPVTVNPLGNDYDVNGDDLTVTIAPGGNPTNGTASVDPVTGEITYTPNPGFYGQDTITYVICDGGTPDLCDTAEIIVTIAPVVDEPNVGPIATNDYGTTPEDTPITIGVMNNDSDPNGNPLNDPTIITPPSNGTASVNADGTITYTPNPNFVGQDTLYYEICDTGSPVICDTAMVVITITPANDAPTTTDIAVETLVDTPIGVNVGAGTSDPENNPLTYTYGAPSVAGTTVTVTGPGNIDVTPPTGFVGTITIPFTVCDSSEFAVNVLCTTGTITVTVVDTTGGANNPPLANNDLVTTDIDSPVTVNPLGNDYDVNGDDLTVTIAPGGNPTNGTASVDPVTGEITYTPNPGFYGQDTITYVICDGGTPDLCDTAEIIVTIAPVVDEPNVGPIATNDYGTTPEDTPITIGVMNNDSDPNGNPLNDPTIITPPSNGTASVNADGTITYTPNPNFVGQDTLYYEICDTGSPVICDTAMVVITITPANDAPTTTDIAVETLVDTPIGVNVGAGTSDPENNPLTYTYGAPSVAGTTVTVTGPGNIDVTPPTGFVGTITIPFTVCDSSEFAVNVLCTTGTITVTVVDTTGGANNPPLANNDLVTTDIDSPVTVNPLGNDYDVNGDDLTVTIAPGGNPTNGTASVDPVTGEITYTPNPGFYGQDTITYVICDGGTPDLCDTAEIIVTIAPVVDEPNVGPIATNDYGTTPEDTPITIGVMNNDSDPNGNPLNDPTIITPPSNGTASVNADGTITYTPNAGFTGQDTLYYVICDTGTPVLCDTAMVVITVVPCLNYPDFDCDGDGIPNSVEVASGTDPNDPCSFDLADVTMTPSQAWLDGDCDGDGVTNGDEVTPPNGGTPTDPSDPCSLTVADQSVTPSQAWLDADCDGDGVTNGDEVTPPNGGTPTDPNDPCSNNSADVSLTLSGDYLVTDCDGDGVTNGDEITPPNGGTPTNPNDPCSLIVADQTVAPSQAWLAADCDGDGITNGDEVIGGSDPFDECSPNPCDIDIPEGFTPDGDGINDFFVIPGIDRYPNNNIIIYNRWGNIVYKTTAYNNDWAGTNNYGLKLDGLEELPTGTYYYVLDSGDEEQGIFKGFVYIQR